MLIKAEKILTRENMDVDRDQAAQFEYEKKDLAKKIVEYMLEKDLIKMEILKEEHDDFGLIVKIRATTRCYHPDD